MFYSPLRYPGGKAKIAKSIADVFEANNLNGGIYIEPYAGGAGVALYLLFNGHASEVVINDLDRSIYAFWHSVVLHNRKFCNKILNTEVDINTWKKCIKIQKNKDKASLFELGFSTFFLNRTNRSGIIKAGPIGGLNQTGTYKIDARFNKEKLIKRIQKIGQFKDKIHVSQLDACDLFDDAKQKYDKEKVFFYLDPPYYEQGKALYVNYYNHEDHNNVAKKVGSLGDANWVVSYDSHEAIKFLYREYRQREYLLNYSLAKPKKGKEVVIFSNNLIIPAFSFA